MLRDAYFGHVDMAGGQSSRKRKVGEESEKEKVGQRSKRKQKAVKKEEEKRLGPNGRVVRWAPKPNAKLQDRIQRAKPGW